MALHQAVNQASQARHAHITAWPRLVWRLASQARASGYNPVRMRKNRICRMNVARRVRVEPACRPQPSSFPSLRGEGDYRKGRYEYVMKRCLLVLLLLAVALALPAQGGIFGKKARRPDNSVRDLLHTAKSDPDESRRTTAIGELRDMD